MILILAVAGCKSGGLRRPTTSALPTPPPLPPAVAVPYKAATLVKRIEERTVQLSWMNESRTNADAYFTGVERSTDLVLWQGVIQLPFTTNSEIILSNQPSSAFYRVFNSIKLP